MHAEERRNRTLAQAIAIFIFEILEHARTEISAYNARILRRNIRGVWAYTEFVIRVIKIQGIIAKLVQLYIIKPNDRDQRMQHIAAIKAIYLQV